MGLLTLLWNSVVEVFSLVALPLTKARGNRRFGQVLRWTFHALAVGLILLCLAWLNYVLDLEQVVRTPWHAARRLWLPLMFTLVYALAWLGWWLWRLAAMPAEASQHPDIDEAWREALQALAHAGIDLSATPLFLVLGRTASPEVCLFNAARMPLAVPQAPRRRDAPLHVYANEEAVYLTCADASLVGRHAKLLMEEAHATATAAVASERNSGTSAGDDKPLSWAADSFDPPREWSPANELEQQGSSVALLEEPEAAQPAPAAGSELPTTEAKAHTSVLSRGDEVELYTARLKHLCRLIVEERRPYCPINGVVVVAPLASTDSDADANQFAAVVEKDLSVLEESFGVSCPLITLMCDLEQADGCEEFIERIPEEHRRRRLGVTFPPVAPQDAAHVPGMVADGLHWLCQKLAPSLVYRLIPSPRAELEDADPELKDNIRRYQFLRQLRSRQDRLARILVRGINPGGTPWQLRGCYLAATGADASRQQAFVAGVFPPFVQLQNALAWTPAALQQDRWFRLCTAAGYACLAAFIALVLALLVL